MYYYEMYVENVKGIYTYKSAKEYEAGQWCLVNFINTNKTALIINKIDESKIDFDLKKIKEIMGEAPVLSIPKVIMELVKWIKDYYLSDYDSIFKAVYPGALKLNYSKKVLYLEDLDAGSLGCEYEEEIRKFNEYMKKKQEVTLLTLKKNFSEEIIKRAENKKAIKIEKKIILTDKTRVDNKDIQKEILHNNIRLNEEQEKVANIIEKGEKQFYLLKGVTGSGKTEIYMRLIRRALEKGDGSIFLVPEISLTTQMIERLDREFQDNIAILHSKLTNAEKSKEWTLIRKGDKKVVIGARSAIFAPVQNLKYIIIDEEHENTYKQEQNPRYHTKNVAIKRAMLEKSMGGNEVRVVLGSATPSFESYYQSKCDDLQLVELKQRFNNSRMPDFRVLDLNSTMNNFSGELLDKIRETLDKKEQVILILNRKSFAPLLKCNNCGEIPICPNCSISLSYYKSDGKLKCNYCGYERNYREKCHKCKSEKMIELGSGTERIEQELKNNFSSAKVVRVDSESVKTKGEYERIYKDFKEQKYDIMIGTQIIAKGFHFPNVTLVGILNADLILNFPDFRAGEKTFQLLTQSAGRAGRGEKRGEVYIQTFNTENDVILKTVGNDYEGYYENELLMRKEFNYPPFGRIISLILSSRDEKNLRDEVVNFHRSLQGRMKDVINIGEKEMCSTPFRAPIYKMNGRFRYQIFIKFNKKNGKKIKRIIKNAMQNFDNKKVRISIDVDPLNMM